MKNSGKIVLCGMCAGLATVIMIASYFPTVTYAVPALAGLIMMVLVIEIDLKWAFLAFLASCLPVFLFAENEAKFLYIAILGYYPILKALIERIRFVVLQYIIKLLCFNAAVFVVYSLLSGMVGISLSDMGQLGKYGTPVLLLAGNVVFFVYDFAISRLAQTYILRLHKAVARIMNKK